MKLRFLIKQSEKIVQDNAPTILAGVAIVGTLATAYLTGRATFQAAQRIVDWEYDEAGVPNNTGTKERAKLVWTLYIPPAAAVVGTIGCIVYGTRMNTQRAVAMAAAYSLSEKKLSEYKSKVEEKLGIEKKTEIDQDITKDQLAKNPKAELIFMGKDDVLVFDSYSGRYFKSSQDSILQAVNATNFEVIHHNFATLEFFWGEIGLEPTAYSDEFGWDANDILEPRFSTMISGDDKPALVLDYDVKPVRGWNPMYNS